MDDARVGKPAVSVDPADNPRPARTRGIEMLGTLWAKWKVLAQRIGDFQARVILTVVYFVVLGPMAIFVRLLRDPLGLKPPARRSTWVAKPAHEDSLEASRRQF